MTLEFWLHADESLKKLLCLIVLMVVPPRVKFYTSLEDFIYDCDSDNDEESFMEPNKPAPYKTDEIKTTAQFLEYIGYLKEWNLFRYGKSKRFNQLLLKTEKPVKELDKMIGLCNLKENIIKLIFSFCRYQLKKELKLKITDPPMMGTVLYGRPGVGKTTAATVVGKILLRLGILSNGKIVYGKRSNMIAKYVGQTAPMTEKLLNNAKGGVLIIDEVYQLGSHKADGDGFDIECINTINQYMSENTDVFVIVCGYKNEVQDCFLSKNSGLERRFPWRYTLDPYKPGDLLKIFKHQVDDQGYTIDPRSKLVNNLFKADTSKKNNVLFFFGGGATKLLLDRIIDNHSARTAGDVRDVTITDKDIERGLTIYKSNMEDSLEKITATMKRESREQSWKDMNSSILASMYT